jgi:signal transduction histidine kinase
VRLPGHVQAEVLRICREALNNARKHADASLVRIRLERDDSVLRLSIRDNGQGFDMNSDNHRAGFGLRSMQERAEVIGGRLNIESAPMEGTRVVLELDRLASLESSTE